jgi:hypothetical protein
VFPNVFVLIWIRFDLLVFLDVFEIIWIWNELLEISNVVNCLTWFDLLVFLDDFEVILIWFELLEHSPTNFASNSSSAVYVFSSEMQVDQSPLATVSIMVIR